MLAPSVVGGCGRSILTQPPLHDRHSQPSVWRAGRIGGEGSAPRTRARDANTGENRGGRLRSAPKEFSTGYSLTQGAPLGPVLEQIVTKAVKHLDEAPCMHFVAGDGTYGKHSVPPAVVAMPQLWHGISEHLAKCNPDMVVLVHRVPNGESDGCPTPCTSTEGSPILQCSNKLLSAGLAEQIMAGKIGDCCEEDNGTPHSQEVIQLALRESGMYDDDIITSHNSSENAAFWGLVLQSSKWSSLDGCYLLKTVKAVQRTGCSCTHFSLMRVCKGVPLAHQYSAGWLV